MAKPAEPGRIDPTWPEVPEGDHAVSELVSDLQGSHSPYGEIQFPLDEVPYVHPVTKVNR